ncbi:MAG: helix-turn-helix domain-containing protein [Candidatus Omnitrophica bacterium]|nr:helix-turn-helix domain-containing protein [Candidatus Omnitrophota bacterium]
MEIIENEVYTQRETQAILKVSSSTVMRMIKKGLIRAAKVGRQYRIMGKELLRILSPELEDQVGKAYNRARKWVHEGMEDPAPIEEKKLAVMEEKMDSGPSRSAAKNRNSSKDKQL